MCSLALVSPCSFFKIRRIKNRKAQHTHSCWKKKSSVTQVNQSMKWLRRTLLIDVNIILFSRLPLKHHLGKQCREWLSLCSGTQINLLSLEPLLSCYDVICQNLDRMAMAGWFNTEQHVTVTRAYKPLALCTLHIYTCTASLHHRTPIPWFWQFGI